MVQSLRWPASGLVRILFNSRKLTISSLQRGTMFAPEVYPVADGLGTFYILTCY